MGLMGHRIMRRAKLFFLGGVGAGRRWRGLDCAPAVRGGWARRPDRQEEAARARGRPPRLGIRAPHGPAMVRGPAPAPRK